MDKIDRSLAMLRDEAVPHDLAGIDGAVMDGLGARREQAFSRRALTLAACIAATAGLALGVDGGSPASAEPLLAMPVSAPSHLLNG